MDEEGVAGEQRLLGHEASRTRAVARGVPDGDLEAAHGDDAAFVVDGELGLVQPAAIHEQGGIVAVHVHRPQAGPDQLRHTGHRMAPEVPTRVIAVVVRHDAAHHAHAVLPGALDQAHGIPRGVHHQALARVPVSYQVGQVHHLGRGAITAGVITTGQALDEVAGQLHELLLMAASLTPCQPTLRETAHRTL